MNFDDINPFVSALVGGAVAEVHRSFKWNAEGRLIEYKQGAVDEGDFRAYYEYDYLGRRVYKKVDVCTGLGPPAQWVTIVKRRYVWDGWKLLEELDGLNSHAVARKFTWGLDLAGQNGSINSLEGAGTIGGLLAVAQAYENHVPQNAEPDVPAGNFLFFYDGNGNVGQLVGWSQITNWQSLGLNSADDWHVSRLAAAYQYDPYGDAPSPVGYDPGTQQLSIAGPHVVANRFRFSTKQWDPETGLHYFGYRYYSPTWGRWISRDPIEEEGGVNLYAYVRNVPTYLVDAWGMKPKWAALTSYMSRDGRAWLVMRDGCCTQSMGVSIDGANVAVAYPEQYGEPADSKTYLKLVDVNALRQSGALKLWWTERYNIRTQEVTLPYTSQDKLWFSGDAALVYAAAENVGAGVTFSRLSVPYRVWPAANNGGTDPGLSMGTFGKFLEAAYISADLICAAGRSGELQLLNPSSAYGADVSLSEGTRRQLTPPYQIGPQRGSSKYRDPVDYIHATTYYLSISGKWFEPEVASGWSVSVKQDAYVYSDDSGGSHTPVWQKQLRHLAMPGQPLPEEPPRPPYDGVVLP